MTNPLRQIGGGMYAPVDVPLANREGCSVCHTQDTEWLSPKYGRRCADHWPPPEGEQPC